VTEISSADICATAALRLIEVLVSMGEQHSNPVLQVLQDNQDVELSRHYPDEALTFGGEHWRAYYHCHDAPGKPGNEHGHFHIFAGVQPQSWSHLAALSMDSMGQPINWFTVNRWVTDGPWCDAATLIACLDNTHIESRNSLVEQWLLCMMTIYIKELSELLRERDISLNRIKEAGSDHDILENREIYGISSTAIDLQDKLQNCISGAGEGGDNHEVQ
jgi:hypothetical protein